MYKVLIVEDDPMVSMINEQYIKRNGSFELVGQCRDGKSALRFLEENEVDLVVLDVYMPIMDGFETLKNIRNMKCSCDVIMVTAANNREALEEAMRFGIVDYLVKPFTYERFQIALDKYIAHIKALQNLDMLNQTNIDYIMEGKKNKSDEIYPKGIQEKTLKLLMEHMKQHSGKWFTGDEIATVVNLTAVTVRRYMNYLSEIGFVVSRMDYETGGRPSVKYIYKQ